MTWNSRYLSPQLALWQGRADAPPKSSFFQIVQLLDLTANQAVIITQLSFAVIGFCCDEGIHRNMGRTGAAEGPDAIRQALAKLPVQQQHFQFFDAGNITCTDGDLEASQQALGEVVAMLLQRGINPIVLGGGHELAWGHYQGITRAFPERNLGIINFDAHLDLRPLLTGDKGTSGTSFLQIAKAHQANHHRLDYNCVGLQHAGNIKQLFETAKLYDTKVIWADELHQGQRDKCVDFIDRILDQNDIIYVSLCLDVFASAFAPGVSTTQPLGLLPWQIIPLIRQLAASGKVISYDLAEMSPRYDIDQITAKLAANLIYEFIHHHHEHPLTW